MPGCWTLLSHGLFVYVSCTFVWYGFCSAVLCCTLRYARTLRFVAASPLRLHLRRLQSLQPGRAYSLPGSVQSCNSPPWLVLGLRQAAHNTILHAHMHMTCMLQRGMQDFGTAVGRCCQLHPHAIIYLMMPAAVGEAAQQCTHCCVWLRACTTCIWNRLCFCVDSGLAPVCCSCRVCGLGVGNGRRILGCAGHQTGKQENWILQRLCMSGAANSSATGRLSGCLTDCSMSRNREQHLPRAPALVGATVALDCPFSGVMGIR
jgi:hypothetical protein